MITLYLYVFNVFIFHVNLILFNLYTGILCLLDSQFKITNSVDLKVILFNHNFGKASSNK